MDDLSSIRIKKETRVRLNALAKRTGITVTALASSILDERMDEAEIATKISIVLNGKPKKPVHLFMNKSNHPVLCGRYAYLGSIEWTLDRSKVTCQGCLKRMSE